MGNLIENKLKGLRIFYFAFGIPVIVFGFLALLLVVLMYDQYFPRWDYLRLLWGIGYFSAGILFFATYYGLKTRKIFTKFTGLIGCTILIIITMLMTILSPNTLSILFYSLFIIVSILLMVSTLYMWDDIPSEEHLRLSQKKKMILVALVCIVATFAVTYNWVNSYKDQEMKDLYVIMSGSLNDICDDQVDSYRFIGNWSRTDMNESYSYEFLYNSTFNAYVSNQTDLSNYTGMYTIANSKLILMINSSSSSYEYDFTSDDTSVTIDNKPYTRQQDD